MNFSENEGRDQVAGDDEEDIDPDKAAAPEHETGMVQNHRHNRDGAQAIDIGAIVDSFCGNLVRLVHV
jgi:hypothetical protein